jgi:GNAT superfamily N-acetyltransferase
VTQRFANLTGESLRTALPGLARLRIEVFRDWPYLYDGSLDYEQTYLAKLAEAPGGLIVALFDGQSIVGCATAAPLRELEGEFSAPLVAKGLDISRVLYCGESVLQPTYRGLGIGHAFFDRREEHGMALGLTSSAFCAVVRPDDHPLRPPGYRPLDAFWSKRGYRQVDGLVGSFSWKDIDQPAETAKSMQYWLKELR